MGVKNHNNLRFYFIRTLIFLCLIFFLITQTMQGVTLQDKNNLQSIDLDWHFLPSYPNYAPAGVPDFDQRQADWKSWGFWSYCGPTAIANILWWFDAKHSCSDGVPGDGIDTYPLVKDYQAPGIPSPGPFSDDHNFNNIDDGQSTFDRLSRQGELIEQLAWYVNNDRCRIPFISIPGVHPFAMKWGVKKWMRDVGLSRDYSVEIVLKPDFLTIYEKVCNNAGVVLQFGFYIPGFELFPLIFHHYVAVAGVNYQGYVALSDPDWNLANPTSDPTLHNDASVVSHDIYQVNYSTPCPRISSWWIPEYATHRRVVVLSALIITEIE